MAGEFSFSQKNRLKRTLCFKLVFEKGIKIQSQTLTLWYLNILDCEDFDEKIANSMEDDDLKKVKLGIIVSRKLGNSVKRNRIKRLLREAFRLSRQKIKDGTWLIISLKKEIKNLHEAMLELNEIFKKADIIKNEE